MKEWIPGRALVSSSWLRSRKIYKCVLLVGALTTGVIIVTWKIQSGKPYFRSSSSDVKTLEIEKQGGPQRLCTSTSIRHLPSAMPECMDIRESNHKDIQSQNLISSTHPTCDQTKNSQGAVTENHEESLLRNDCCMMNCQHEFELSGIKFENDTSLSMQSVYDKQYVDSCSMSSSLGSMEHKRIGNGTSLAHKAPLSTSSSSLGFSSTVIKADTLSTISNPIYKQPVNSNSDTVPQNIWVIPSLSGRFVHMIDTISMPDFCHQRFCRSSSRVYLKSSKDIESTEVLIKSIPPAKFSLRGKIPDTIDSNSHLDDSYHCDYQMKEPFTNVSLNHSSVKACFGVVMCEEMYGLLHSNENQSRGMKNVVASQGSYLAKLQAYDRYLMDPKLSLHMKSQVERAKASLRKFYEIGEP